MANGTEVTTTEQWHELLETSLTRPVVLLKHSTTCPISAAAWTQFQNFVESQAPESARFTYIKVIEARPLSNLIAQESGVKHESPQVLILHGGKVVWNASHWSITEQALKAALGSVQSA